MAVRPGTAKLQSSSGPPRSQRESGCWARRPPPRLRLGFASTRCLTRSRSRSTLIAEPGTAQDSQLSALHLQLLAPSSLEEHRGFNILSTAWRRNQTEHFAFTTDAALAMVMQMAFPPEPSPALHHQVQKPARASLSNILMSRYILHS